jgi:EAL domain-containing protein (putative c-di-GMP-specific phosphodiesterase class I)/signal transduction histidine kinase/DNA-binding NarL/FixJ family response regulator
MRAPRPSRDAEVRRDGRKTIRYKLILLVMAPLSMAVALIAGLSTWRDATDAIQLERARLTYTAQILAAVAAEATETGDPLAAEEALSAISQAHPVAYARIEDASGRILAQTGDLARVNPAETDQAGLVSVRDLFETHTIQVSVPVRRGEVRSGSVLMLGETVGPIGQASSGLMATLFGAALAGLIGMAVAYRMQTSISGPIVGLTRAMAQVRQTRSYHLSATFKSDDEIGDLVEGFNGMLGEIRARDLQLANHVANLEREVDERTEDLLAAKNTAEAANASKSDFLATMSHEIRTPMNGIMVMAEMLASSDIGHRPRRYAEVIAKSGRSLLAIINDILDFSKIEAGKMELEQIPLDPSELVDDVASLFWERARHKKIDLAAFVDPALPRRVLGDPVRLRQVVGNLVNNAIKFTESGGVLIRVEPAPCAVGPERIRISVQDTGIGIPADKIDGLFVAFTQVDQSTTRRFGGTGLGLAICKRLIDAMGGVITVASVEGRGSTFSFEVAAPSTEPAQAWPRLEGRSASLAASGLATRFALGRYLQLAGVHVGGPDPDFSIGEPAHFRDGAAPRPAVCLAEYADPMVGDLLNSGAVDALVVAPVRRSDIEAVLQRLAEGRSLADLQREPQSPSSAAEAVTPRFEGRRVLVADDSVVNREVAVEALTRLGAASVVVENGALALQAVIQDPNFDLVLMDGSMPEMDGFEATRAIRFEEKNRGRRRVPVVALTAHVVGGAAEAWRAADMDAVVHKPFNLRGLAETMARFIQPSGYGPARVEAPRQANRPSPVAQDDILDPTVSRDLAAMAAGGRGDFVEKIHRLYRSNAPHSLLAIKDAVEASDAMGVATSAHALKSMSYNVGAKRVAAHCGALEDVAREGGTVTLDEVRLLALALESTLRALSSQPSAETPATQSEEALLVADLRTAIVQGDLTMVYQAQMDRSGTELVGCEALVRWVHPTRGSVSPAEFVPVAERAGVIGQLTEYVVRRICVEMAHVPTLKVSFNASALEFCKPDFAERMSDLIAECGFDPTRLEVEITETAVVEDAETAKANITRLRANGIKVALDDFGAGYTSLRFLRMFPFDKLKIDREFIQGCEKDSEAATIVHAVVSIGRALGMKVVAEGVETEAERSFLKNAGVHGLQGWLFGKALPARAFLRTHGLTGGAAANPPATTRSAA